MDPNAAPRLASERGALARPNPIMEALLRMERANAMAANGLLYPLPSFHVTFFFFFFFFGLADAGF